MSVKVCLITGATGAIGPRVVEEFRSAGYTVRTLSRNPAAGMDSHFQGDVGDLESVRRAMSDVDCAVHLAALLHINDPAPSLAAEYRRVNVGGTENVMRAAEESGVRRVVLMSTIAVYGYSAAREITEETTPMPDTLYGTTKLEAERVAMSAGDRGVVLRLAATYGARVKGNYLRLLRSLARRRFVPIGRGANRRTMVYDRDVARAALLAATHHEAAGRIYNVTDGTVHTVHENLESMSRALGVALPRFSLPVGPVRFAAGLCDTASRVTGVKFPVTRAVIDKYVEDVVVRGERIVRELGFAPQWDLDSGWRETVTILRAEGEL